jgi:hypothetical protein
MTVYDPRDIGIRAKVVQDLRITMTVYKDDLVDGRAIIKMGRIYPLRRKYLRKSMRLERFSQHLL